MTHPFPITVSPDKWWSFKQHAHIDTVRIQVGDHFVVLPVAEARRVIDIVHDLCDDYEREHRAH